MFTNEISNFWDDNDKPSSKILDVSSDGESAINDCINHFNTEMSKINAKKDSITEENSE